MITPGDISDYPAIIDLWEHSVRATHHFLPEKYLQEIKLLLPTILPQVKIYTWRDETGTLKGFAGVAGKKMEMLFIHPSSRGQGIGRMLAEYCIYILHADLVDVNEQNEQAVLFYRKIGYEQIGRLELDGLGRPFPLLQLKHKRN
jgi:putative acetyltransferase